MSSVIGTVNVACIRVFLPRVPLLWFSFCMNNDKNAGQPAPAECGEAQAGLLPKKDRVALIFTQLKAAPPPSSRESALSLLDQIFRKVEDAHSGLPHDPHHVERMYPPVAEMEKTIPGQSWLRRYRHTSHVTLIAESGAIEIRTIERGMINGVKAIIGEKVVFEKPGADGRRVSEMK